MHGTIASIRVQDSSLHTKRLLVVIQTIFLNKWHKGEEHVYTSTFV